MTDATPPEPADGRVRTPERQGDVLAIQELVVAYGHAVDDRDWARWEALFTVDAHI
ncbi:MAG: nuclear transport factor 2 family protein, partial [Acidimicrobiia bacterium]